VENNGKIKKEGTSFCLPKLRSTHLVKQVGRLVCVSCFRS